MGNRTATVGHHILPLKVYLGVGAALIVLTAITVTVSFFNFGPYNLLVAMVVAAIKASLVALFFMHLKYDSKLYMIIFVAAILFLAVFIIFTLFDTLLRGDVEPITARPIRKEAVIYDSLSSQPAATDSSGVTADSVGQMSDDH